MCNIYKTKQLLFLICMSLISLTCVHNAQSSELDEISELSSLYDSWLDIGQVEIYQGYAYLMEDDTRIIVLDMNNLESQPEEINTVSVPGLSYIEVYEDYMYAVAYNLLYTLSIANPTSPEIVNCIELEHIADYSYMNGFFILKTFISREHEVIYFFCLNGYSTSGYGDLFSYNLQIYDISDPETPSFTTHIQQYQNADKELFPDEDYLYSIAKIRDWNYNYFLSFEIYDPHTLQTINSFDFSSPLIRPNNTYQPFRYEDIIFIPTDSVFVAVDFSNINSPVWIESDTHFGSKNIAFDDKVFSFENNQLQVYDISNFPDISLVSTQDFPELAGNVISIEADNSVFAAPAEVDIIDGQPISGTIFFSLSETGSTEVEYSTAKNGIEFISSCKFENNLFILDSTDSLRVVDISNPLNPVQTSVSTIPATGGQQPTITKIEANEDVVVVRRNSYIFVFNRPSNEQIEYVSTIDQFIFSYQTERFQMKFIEDVLVVTGARHNAGNFGIYAYDLENPGDPNRIDYIQVTSSGTFCAGFDNDYVVHAIERHFNINRYDCSQPENITQLESEQNYILGQPEYIDFFDEYLNYSHAMYDEDNGDEYGVFINDNHFVFTGILGSLPNLAFIRQGNEYYHGNRYGINIFQVQGDDQVNQIEEYAIPDLTLHGLHPHGNKIIAVTKRSVKILQSDQLLDSPEIEPVPQEFEIISLYPNPFNASISASFNLPRPGDVAISVYNLLGQQVFSEMQHYQAGINNWYWNGKSNSGIALASGIYFLNIDTGKQQLSRKIMMLK